MLGSLFDFAKDMGKKLFTSDAEAGINILQHIEANNPGVNPLNVTYEGGAVTLTGRADSEAAKQKAVLMAGNVEGVESVNADGLETPPAKPAAPPEPEVEFYTVESGDSLSLIAKQFYGDAMKYTVLFEENREVIEDPNKIYPGQKIRIPKIA